MRRNSSEILLVWSIAGKIQDAIQQLVNGDGKYRHLVFKKPDQLRLLKLHAWSLQYYIPVGEILEMVVPPLRSMIKKKRKNYGLGVSIPTLTGNGALRILQEEITKRYPNGEHYAVWRVQEQAKQLEAERVDELDGVPIKAARSRSLLEAPSVEAYITSYRRQILTARDTNNKALSSAVRKRKQYAGNPWI